MSAYPPVVLFLTLTAAMATSLDYGDHWDEQQQLGQVANTYATGSLLTHYYNYPSGSYWLTLVATVPYAIGGILQGDPVQQVVTMDALLGRLRIPIRFVFLLVTNLALVWVFFICRRAGAPVWAAFLSSLFLGLSFEFSYHSRWIATDGPTAQFVALALWLSCRFVQEPRASAFPPAVAAGLAFGTKYNAALVLIPVLTALACRNEPRGRRLSVLLPSAIVVFVAVFIVTTPGAIWEPATFLKDVRNQMHFYGHVLNFAFSVQPGVDHLWKMIRYLIVAAMSPYEIVSILLVSLSPFGALALYRRDHRLFLILAPLPVIYLLYACTFRVMIVRNLLLLLPIVAVFAALGAHEVWRLSRRHRLVRLGIFSVLSACLALNAYAYVIAIRSIVVRRSVDVAREITRHVERSETPLYLSPRVRATLGSAIEPLRRSGKVVSRREAKRTILWNKEVYEGRFPANSPGTYELLRTGPFDINFDYYGSWTGYPRPLIIDTALYTSLWTARPTREPLPLGTRSHGGRSTPRLRGCSRISFQTGERGRDLSGSGSPRLREQGAGHLVVALLQAALERCDRLGRPPSKDQHAPCQDLLEQRDRLVVGARFGELHGGGSSRAAGRGRGSAPARRAPRPARNRRPAGQHPGQEQTGRREGARLDRAHRRLGIPHPQLRLREEIETPGVAGHQLVRLLERLDGLRSVAGERL